ncbi:MAG: hypothetical protein LAT64_09855 [Phycisphaerales bacterium]|nr:hypothetical protein [Planctomycetota bacterium]MCH8509053.1 hypothetical protein [Phycisphaerales bacterium]
MKIYRVKVHAIEREGEGWYGCFHIAAPDRTAVERILSAFAAFEGLESLTPEAWLRESPSMGGRRSAILREEGRIIYSEGRTEGPLTFFVQRWPFRTFSRIRRDMRLIMFNRSIAKK